MSSTGVVTEKASQVGLGYGIAIAVGVLVLVSTIMLASYVCVKLHSRATATVTATTAATAELSNSNNNGDQFQNQQQQEEEEEEENMDMVVVESFGVGGLDQGTINSYPKMVMSRKQKLPRPTDTCCCICLVDYRSKDVLRMLPDCSHFFHAECVDPWLKLNASCPVCRSSPLPSPVSTPLAELIPLARQLPRSA